MSREIKFRAWDADSRKMLTPDYLIESGLGWVFNNDGFYPMQYTGLKDKNSDDIYDKDIVEFKIGAELCRGVVSYDEASARWIKTFTSRYGAESKDLSSYASSQKVIGNIYDNPELLEAAS